MNISKPVLYAACASFLVLVAVVSFLLGRESHRRNTTPIVATSAPAPVTTPPAPPAPPAQPPSVAPSAHPYDPYTPAPSPVDPYAPRAVAPMPSAVTAAPAPAPAPPPVAVATSAPTPPPAPTTNRADAIRTYFISVAAIQTFAATGDSTQLAQQLLASAAGGDSSGFDHLVDSARQGIDKARALQPPPECAGYHDKLLALLADGVKLMTQLKQAIARSDTGALTSIASTGTALQSRAQALSDEERRIKSSAGVL